MSPPSEAVAVVTQVRRSTLSIRLPHASRLLQRPPQAQVHEHGTSLGLDTAWTAAEPALDLFGATDPHDAFFRVARDAQGDVGAYQRGVLAAQQLLHDESGDDADPGPAAAALHATLAALRSADPAPALSLSLPASRPATPRSLERSIRRWLRGHQVFAVVTQGLVLAVHDLQRAFAEGADEALQALHLQRLADLYTATALAMRFTADFPREHYEHAIRPAMSEPHAPAGFSGALSADHAVLVQRLMAARPAMEHAARHRPAEHARVKQALADMYEDHKRVCARLAGLDTPSIRSAGLTPERHAAGELLDRFHARRSLLLR